ncbi:MAG: hypothetical protein ACLP1X_31490 [Polyangiaceae bacterium]
MRVLATVAAVAVFAFGRTALADKSSEAVAELKTGYALKQSGACAEAIPHFDRSYQLDPKPKALLNRADCEAKLGDLVAAQRHASEGRDLARTANDPDLWNVADDQLAAIEKKLAYLTIRLAPGAPTGAVVSMDGMRFDRALGFPSAANPGAHSILVTAPGRNPRAFAVALTAGASAVVEVEPGPSLDAAPTNAEATVPTKEAPAPFPRMPLLVASLSVAGLGTLVGFGAGVAATSKHDALASECPGGVCPPSAQGNVDSFHSLRTWSTVGYVFGVLGLAGGAVLWFAIPSDQGRLAPRAWIAPGRVGVAGSF